MNIVMCPNFRFLRFKNCTIKLGFLSTFCLLFAYSPKSKIAIRHIRRVQKEFFWNLWLPRHSHFPQPFRRIVAFLLNRFRVSVPSLKCRFAVSLLSLCHSLGMHVTCNNYTSQWNVVYCVWSVHRIVKVRTCYILTYTIIIYYYRLAPSIDSHYEKEERFFYIKFIHFK